MLVAKSGNRRRIDNMTMTDKELNRYGDIAVSHMFALVELNFII